MLDVFKFIKWLLKTLFWIIGGLIKAILGLDQEAHEIKFNGEVITDKNFVILNKSFAKDSTTAYYKDYSFSYADVPTFEALDEHYAKDKDRAYYCDEYREGQNYYLTKKQRILTVQNPDIPTFISLGNGYAKDKTNAYYQGVAFKVKQVSSLVCINSYFYQRQCIGISEPASHCRESGKNV